MPDMMLAAARFTAVMPEPQKRSSVTPLALMLQPASSTDMRPMQVALLPDLRAAAPDHVVDLLGAEVVPLLERAEHGRAEPLRVQVRKSALALLADAARGANRVDDPRFSRHGSILRRDVPGTRSRGPEIEQLARQSSCPGASPSASLANACTALLSCALAIDVSIRAPCLPARERPSTAASAARSLPSSTTAESGPTPSVPEIADALGDAGAYGGIGVVEEPDDVGDRAVAMARDERASGRESHLGRRVVTHEAHESLTNDVLSRQLHPDGAELRLRVGQQPLDTLRREPLRKHRQGAIGVDADRRGRLGQCERGLARARQPMPSGKPQGSAPQRWLTLRATRRGEQRVPGVGIETIGDGRVPFQDRERFARDRWIAPAHELGEPASAGCLLAGARGHGEVVLQAVDGETIGSRQEGIAPRRHDQHRMRAFAGGKPLPPEALGRQWVEHDQDALPVRETHLARRRELLPTDGHHVAEAHVPEQHAVDAQVGAPPVRVDLRRLRHDPGDDRLRPSRGRQEPDTIRCGGARSVGRCRRAALPETRVTVGAAAGRTTAGVASRRSGFRHTKTATAAAMPSTAAAVAAFFTVPEARRIPGSRRRPRRARW